MSAETTPRPDLREGETLCCQDCGSVFTVEDVRKNVADWQRVLARIDRMFAD
jgi:hypothetical protein